MRTIFWRIASFAMVLAMLFSPLAQSASVAARQLNDGPQPPVKDGPHSQPVTTQELEAYYGRLAARQGPIGVVVEFKQQPAAVLYAEKMKDGVAPDLTAQSTADAVEAIQQTQDAFMSAVRGIDSSARELYSTQRVYNGVWLYVDAAQVSKLAKLPNVKALHPMIPKTLDHTTSVPLIGAPAVWAGSGVYQGQGIKVGIIDTGIDYIHTNFGGNGNYTGQDYTILTEAGNVFPTAKVVGGWDFAGDAYDASGTGSALTPVPDPDPMDCGGHGSHVAGSAAGAGVLPTGATYTESGGDTYAALAGLTPDQYMAKFRIGPGVAPKASLYSLRVFGCEGSTDLTEAAIEWAMDPDKNGDLADHLDVINMSLGSSYGSEYDTSAVASNNAAAAGVVVVASAGNSGDAYYITGAPAVANRAISVASSQDAGAVVSAFEVTGDTSGTFTALPSQQPGVESEWTPTFTDVTGDLAMATPANGCTAITGVNGKIALIDRGTCTFQLKYENAVAAGATGVLVANNVDGFPFQMGGTPAVTVPAMMTTKAVGTQLKTAMSSGTVTVKLTSAYQNAFLETDPTLVDTISSFSSRGLARVSSNLKPDITAPGDTIFSTANGTGNKGVSFGGTSMSSPHVAGAMALLRQEHPTWTVAQLKALVMNTATTDIASVFGGAQKRTPSRVGAGRLTLPNAISSDVVAFSANNSAGVSVSFGIQQVVETTAGVDKTLTQDITVKNLGASDQTYDLAFVGNNFYQANPGVSITVTPAQVTVSAGNTATATVTVTLDAALLKKTVDPDIVVNPYRAQQAEAGGYVALTSTGSAPALRVPVHISPRAASAMSTTETELNISTVSGTLDLHPTGTAVGTTNDYSTAAMLELVGESPALSSVTGTSQASADLQYIGAMANHVTGAEEVFFGISTFADWDTLASTEFDIYVDTNEDGTDDYAIYNTATGLGGADIMMTVVVDLTTGSGVYSDFVNWMYGSYNTNLFNNNVAVFPVYLADLGLDAANPDFDFYIVTWHRDAPSYVDQSDIYHYNTAAAQQAFDTNAPAASVWAGLPFADDDAAYTPTIPVAYNTANFTPDTKGLLLLHLHNKDNRAQVLAVSQPFSDISTSWANFYINKLYYNGITAGYPDGTYRPDNSVTRAEMAVFLLKAKNGSTYTAPVATPTFPDTSGSWAVNWIEALKAAGITGGYPDGTYRPDNVVTRAEMAVFLLKAKNGSAYTPPVATPTFSDTSGSWAVNWIEALKAAGITGGYPDGTYRPDNAVTRAEMAVFLTKTFNLP